MGIAEREVAVVPRDNDNRARAKAGRSRVIPASPELMRLYADYLNREYGALDSDYVFVNLWSEPLGRPWAYPAVYDLVLRLRERTGITSSPTNTAIFSLLSCRVAISVWRLAVLGVSVLR